MTSTPSSLSGIPLSVVPPTRIQQTDTPTLHDQLHRQILSFQMEVGNIHSFSTLMEEHGDETLQGVAEQIALYMRHFDTRLNEMGSLITVLGQRDREKTAPKGGSDHAN